VGIDKLRGMGIGKSYIDIAVLSFLGRTPRNEPEEKGK
jgi:hypothetical protein